MTLVKICGLQDQGSVEACLQFGADFLGFVFAPSQRQVTPETVRRITNAVPTTVKKVGVFVSPSLEELEKISTLATLDILQIHGTIPQGSHLPIIEAVAVTANRPAQLQPKAPASFRLLDAPSGKYAGGTGRSFSWESIPQQKQFNPQLLIAGGLNSQNVQAAIQHFQPYAVDVSSGVETAGKKDYQKIATFIKTVKEYDYVSTTK